jgi:hypothetical protein
VTGPAVAIIGVLLVLGTWLSVLRTVFSLRAQASLLARGAARAVGTAMLGLARRVPAMARDRLLDYATPLIVVAMALAWLAGNAAGFALLAAGAYRISVNVRTLACFAALCSSARRSQLPVTAAAWLSTVVIMAVGVAYLALVTSAHGRRELMTGRLAADAAPGADAETILSRYLTGGGRSHLATAFGEWADWLTDVQSTHLAYPALVYSRSPNGCWTHSAQLMLDCAALAEACAPDWVPPQAGTLLTVGTRCLPQLAARLGLDLPPAVVSYQGRESQPFTRTLNEIRAAGLPVEVSDDLAQAAFQLLRVQYAPFANAICERLFAYEGR